MPPFLRGEKENPAKGSGGAGLWQDSYEGGRGLAESLGQLVGEGAELFVGEFYVVVEVHVALVLHGDEVDVCVRYFQT